MSLKKQAINGMLWTFIQQFGVQGINFLVSLILARLILPSEFGLIAMISVFIGIGNTLINSGMSQSLLRTKNPDEDDFSTIFYFNISVSIFVYLLIFSLAPFIAQFFHQEILKLVIRVYCLTFIINSFSSIQIIRLTLKFDFKSQALISIPSILAGSIVGLILAYLNFGVWSLIWSSIIQSVISTLQYWYFGNWIPIFKFNKSKILNHWQFGNKLLVSGLIDNIFINIYSIAIGKYFNPEQAGYFQRADSLKQFPVSNISAIVSKVTYPLLSSIQNDDLRLKEIYRKILQTVMYSVTPILIISAILAHPIIEMLYTSKWLHAVPFFQILCFSGILYPIHIYNLDLLNVKGRSDLFLKLEIVKTIPIIIIILISVNWGINGLLISTIFSSIFSLYINSYYTSTLINYGFKNQLLDLLPIMVISIIMGCFVFIIDKYIIKNYFNSNFIRIFLSGISGILIYYTITILFKLEPAIEIKKNIFKK
jgi:teichuronic acid exporter